MSIVVVWVLLFSFLVDGSRGVGGACPLVHCSLLLLSGAVCVLSG